MKSSIQNTQLRLVARAVTLALVVTVGLAACGDKSDGMISNEDTLGAVAVFDPTAGKIPFPSNLLFAGSTDGTLNIPNPTTDPIISLNALDGFSTNAPWSTTFVGNVKASSFVLGETVRVFKVTLSGQGGAVISVDSELGAGDVAIAVRAQTDQAQLIVAPIKPLSPKTSYMVVLAHTPTKSIADAYGHRIVADTTYAFSKSTKSLVSGAGKSLVSALSDEQATKLEPVRQLTEFSETRAVTFSNGLVSGSLSRSAIILTSVFTTQSTSDALVNLKAIAAPGAVTLVDSTRNTKDINSALAGAAEIYVGTLALPYYLDKAQPLTGHWKTAAGGEVTAVDPQNNTDKPVQLTTETVPVLLTVPKVGAKPPGGWPIVIFQHGVTQDRTNLLAVADSLAQAGLAAVAIDLPLHGITDTLSPLYVPTLERTLDLDVINNTSSAPAPDSKIDPTGTHFINLRSLLTSRDNVRQAVADLFTLTATIPNMDYDTGGPDFDSTKIYFLGHSLGAMVGTSFLALSPEIKAAALVNTGGGTAKVLDGSAIFGPIIVAGLKAGGVEQGTASYDQFMVAAQTVLDAGDPLNYFSTVATNRPFLAISIKGDQTIPNTVSGAPLAGGDPIVSLMQLPAITQTSSSVSGIKGYIRFATGSHNSLLDPSIDLAVTTEMQTQLATFLGSGGNAVTVTAHSLLVH